MKIKEKPEFSIYKKLPNVNIELKCFFVVLGSMAIILASIAYGIMLHKTQKTANIKEFILNIKETRLKTISNYIKGKLSVPEHIYIDVKYKYFQKLAHKRDIALEQGVLITGPDDYIPAKIRYRDKIVDVKLRLKGDLVDHLRGDKWSFRIKVKGDNTLFGMKVFSLQHPRARNYIYEWIFHQALKRDGVLALRYKFIDLTLNGKDLGIYALEEHFDKRLLESNRRREGPIIKFSDEINWQHRTNNRWSYERYAEDYLCSNIEAFQSNRINRDPLLKKECLKAITLLEKFRRRELKTSEVFDIDKLAKYYAISDMMSAVHSSLFWDNVRFYYNPVTSKLEPIGFNGYPGRKLDYPIIAGGGNLFMRGHYQKAILDDELFLREYVQQLVRVSQPEYLDSLFDELNDKLVENLNIIYKSFPVFSFSKKNFYYNQEAIRQVLNPIKAMHAYFKNFSKETKHINIELGNLQQIPIEVMNISYKKSIIFEPEAETILERKEWGRAANYHTVSFVLPEGFMWSDEMIADLRVNYRLIGTHHLREEIIFPIPRVESNFVKNDFIRRKSNIDNFDCLMVDREAKTLFFKPGQWNLGTDLIIPEGYNVIAGGGIKLNLCNNAKILSYSPIEFIGSEENPISIISEHVTGQGIVVLQAKRRSRLEYVQFKNLSAPKEIGWELTGSVSFYESPVKISHCQFVNNQSEDALNIIRSDFEIDNTLFKKTLSDAFDSDFCKGKIVNSSFVDCGNDAIDVSGSVIELKNIFINGVGDKGLSVGENSKMIAEDVQIKGANIAAASKDTSELAINKAAISNCKTGFAVYQKKSEFGPASITIKGLTMNRVDIPYLVEKGSKLEVDGKRIEPDQENVRAKLY